MVAEISDSQLLITDEQSQVAYFRYMIMLTFVKSDKEYAYVKNIDCF